MGRRQFKAGSKFQGRKSTPPYSAQPVQRGHRHEGQQAPRVVEDEPDRDENEGFSHGAIPAII